MQRPWRQQRAGERLRQRRRCQRESRRQIEEFSHDTVSLACTISRTRHTDAEWRAQQEWHEAKHDSQARGIAIAASIVTILAWPFPALSTSSLLKKSEFANSLHRLEGGEVLQ